MKTQEIRSTESSLEVPVLIAKEGNCQKMAFRGLQSACLEDQTGACQWRGTGMQAVPDQCLVEGSKCSAGKELFCLMMLCNRCIAHLPLPLPGAPSSVPPLSKMVFGSIKPKAFGA